MHNYTNHHLCKVSNHVKCVQLNSDSVITMGGTAVHFCHNLYEIDKETFIGLRVQRKLM